MIILIAIISLFAATNVFLGALNNKRAMRMTVLMYWLLVWLYWIIKMWEAV